MIYTTFDIHFFSWIWDYYNSEVNPVGSPDPKFYISGMIEGISSAISSLSVSPFPPENGELLVALGTYNGTVQVKAITAKTNQPVRLLILSRMSQK
jgi:hypothetical protein